MNILDNVKGELIPYDDPILTSPQEDWKFDEYPQEEAAKLGLLLIETSKKLTGAGLSANQIGLPYKVFCLTPEESFGLPNMAMFNMPMWDIPPFRGVMYCSRCGGYSVSRVRSLACPCGWPLPEGEQIPVHLSWVRDDE